MKFTEFRDNLLNLASDENIELRQIQAFITRYFKKMAIPHLESLLKFVVRCSMNKLGEVFKNISRCSYNPNIKDIKLQRCNYPEQQVFYCSMYTDSDFASSSLTCIVETAWEHIEDLSLSRTYCTLSRWQCNRPLQLWALPFSDRSCKKNRDFEKIRKNMTKIIKEEHKGSDDIIKSLEFISDIFAEKNNKKINYKISSSFYNALCYFERYKNFKLDGLLYPSANTEGAGINIAIKKELIDNKTLWCDVATMYSLQRSPNDPKNISAMPASKNAWTNDEGDLNFFSIY